MKAAISRLMASGSLFQVAFLTTLAKVARRRWTYCGHPPTLLADPNSKLARLLAAASGANAA